MKEIERAGFTVVQLANLIPVAESVGANRIVPTVSIPYPMGDPKLPQEEQWQQRLDIVERALEALETDIDEQTVFSTEH